MIEEAQRAFERLLRQELKPDEQIMEVEENASGVWFITSHGRILSFIIFECDNKPQETL